MDAKKLKQKYNRLREDPSQLQMFGDQMIDLVVDNKEKADEIPSTEGLDPDKIYVLKVVGGVSEWVEVGVLPPSVTVEDGVLSVSDLDEIENETLIANNRHIVVMNQGQLEIYETEYDLIDARIPVTSVADKNKLVRVDNEGNLILQ